MNLWNTEFRIVYYHWEYDTLLSFYKDILRFDRSYSWYASPVDRGSKFSIGDSRLELICRRPNTPQGTAGMRLQAVNINYCYNQLVREPRVTVIRPIAEHIPGEKSFTVKDPVGNWVEVYQNTADIPHGADSRFGTGRYFTGEFTAILFVDDPDKLLGFYGGAMGMRQDGSRVHSQDGQIYRFKSAAGYTELRKKLPHTPQGPGLITIEAHDVDEAYRQIIGKPGVHLLWDMEDTYYGIRMFQFTDDEGNMVEAIMYRRNLG